MECPQFDFEAQKDFFARLRSRGRRLPLSGSFELTCRCNLRCVHCYIGAKRSQPPSQPELSTGEIRAILDQLADAGTLWLLLTGGEPLLRPDFQEIYAYARHKGLILSLFTNGTLLTPQMADFLAEWPPYNVEITLYGATQATYEQVAGVSGAHARCLRAIDLLLERGIPLRLKAMAMRSTAVEIAAMREFSRSRGLAFKFDSLLWNDYEGGQTAFGQRLQPGEVVELDQVDPERLEEWRAFYRQQAGIAIRADQLFTCGAGLYSYHIDPAGMLSICMAARSWRYDLRQGTFLEGWQDFLPRVRFQPAGEYNQCNQCPLRPLCGQCPAFAAAETGDPDDRIPYLCEIGRLRAQAIGLNPSSVQL